MKLSNDELRAYAGAWQGNWVVIANIPTEKEKLDAIRSKYEVDNPDHWEGFDREIFNYRNQECNLSFDFATEDEARDYAVESIRAGATYLMVLNPDTYDWLLTDAQTSTPALRLAGEKIAWLSDVKGGIQ